MDFFLFLLVNCTLFIRPAEIIPALEGLPIYNCLILISLAISFPKIVDQLHLGRLIQEPMTLCVVGMMPAIAMSHLAHFDTYSARFDAFDFFKTVLYFLLLNAVINSTWRMRTFAYAIAVLTTITAIIAMLHYFEIISIPALVMYEQGDWDVENGELTLTRRLHATGNFGDPNDFSVAVVFAMIACAMGFTDRELGVLRFGWVVPIVALMSCLLLTSSRGGLLALMAALGTFSWYRFGLFKSMILACMGLPALLLIGGRQADFDAAFAGGTGSDRVELWSEAMQLFKGSPLFGIGMNLLSGEITQVAHNSFVQCFSELGLFGGAIFFGLFWFTGLSLAKLREQLKAYAPLGIVGDGIRMQPFFLAMLLGLFTSLMSLSRSYVVTTYVFLGVVNAFDRDCRQRGIPATVTIDARGIRNLIIASLGLIICIYAFIKISVR